MTKEREKKMKTLVKVPVTVEKVVERVVESKSEIQDVADGLITLLDTNVMVMCASYIYAGKLVGVNETCIKLEDAGIVYETGPYTSKGYKDVQKLPGTFWFI